MKTGDIKVILEPDTKDGMNKCNHHKKHRQFHHPELPMLHFNLLNSSFLPNAARKDKNRTAKHP